MSGKVFALIISLYIIVGVLVSTYNYETTSAASGVAYTEGTATFTFNSTEVVGSGTSWSDATMADGIIQYDADEVWCKITSVEDTTHLTLAAAYTELGGSGTYTMAPSGAFGGSMTTPQEGEETDLTYVLNIKNAIQLLPVLGPIPLPVPNSKYFEALWRMITLDVPFLQEKDADDNYTGYYYVQLFLYVFAFLGVLSLVLLVVGIFTGNVTWG